MQRLLAALAVFGCLMAAHAAPVRVTCLDFIGGAPVTNTEFIWMENGTSFLSDDTGHFYFDAEVGSNVTLNFLGNDKYHAMQGVTVTVPEGGLNTELTEIVMQMPSNLVYDAFTLIIPGKRNYSACQVVVTVCNVNKTVHDLPQGLLGTEVFLNPPLQTHTYFFGTWGKLSNETNPFPNNLTVSSWDGGVLFENVPQDPDTWYTVSAYHKGYTFSTTKFRCTAPNFINGAPNQGPRATPASGRWWEDDQHPLRQQ